MRQSISFLFIIFGVMAGLSTTAGHSEDGAIKKIQLGDYLDFERVSNPQISPDGSQILFGRRRIDKMNDRFTSSIWLMNRDGSKKRELMKGGGAIWSPDGSRIAFVKPDTNGKPQIFVRWMDAEGLVTQVTAYENRPRSMAWSPDGQSIAFVARVPADNKWRVKLPGKPQGAKWTPDPVKVDSLLYRQDRVGYNNNGYDHLFVVPAEGGTPRQLTFGEWNVGRRGLGTIAFAPSISWSPDGKLIAFDGPGKPLETRKWWVSHVHTVAVETGEITSLTVGDGSWVSPKFSPDGSAIAYVGFSDHKTTYDMSNLYVMDADGANKRALTQDVADSPGQIMWAKTGKAVLYTMNNRGQRNIHKVDMKGRVTDITKGAQVIGLSSLSDTGEAAFTHTASDKPGAIAILDKLNGKAKPKRLTDVNGDIFHGVTFGRVEEIWYEATAETGEKADVQGWIVLPPDYDPKKKYPLVLSIHGGPHAMYNSAFNFTFQEFAARGYVVLYTNPRGSTGYGDAFANAIAQRYPGPVDYADLMAGVDVAIEKGYADPDRLFVTGCSGGGVLTTWIIGQTDRFKAAAALCPVVNWIGMSGTTDVVGWLYDFFPKPFWEDPKPWLDYSTIMHVGKVKTPTLLMTGTKDLRTPLGEAEEYFAALKYRGIPTRLVPMNGEYHGTRSIPSNYLRTSLYLREWFDTYDPAKAK